MRMRLPAAALLVAALVPACASTPPPPARGPLTITAVANAGVLLSDGQAGVLIDALFRDGVEGYARLGGAEREAIEAARPPFDAVGLVLVTHKHADHFDPAALAAHLAANPGARAALANEVAALVDGPADRLVVATPEPGGIAALEVNGFPVSLVRLAHNPSRNFPEEHVGQAVRISGRLVLHVGDAEPSQENFRAAEPLGPVDIAIVPYWYLLEEEGRRIVGGQLRARRVIAVHVEPDKAEEIRRKVMAAWPGVAVLAREGDRAEFRPEPY